QITQIPEALANLTNLTQLILYNNQITQIPEAIANLTNLTQLDLDGNQITQIPEAIAKLTNLTQLHLSYNQITQIPEAIENLPKLEKLDLRGNRLPNLEITEWVPVPNYPNHPPLDYQELLGLESMGESTITIGKLKLKLDLRQLLDGYESLESRQKIQKVDPESDRFTIVNKIYNNHQGDFKPMTENTNNFQGANIANFANEVKDNASQQASNFNQTSGANISEILQLIGNLRQTAAQFPPETRDDMIIDIDDVEAEIQKPEKERNLPKLKKRLVALLTAATVVAAPIAGMTDFENNVIDIGNKVGIELKLPSVK
ncbi:MAG: leucine-rich repeat domain-containing protein, partial [Nostoc sp.]|uniref:leucine-rich repeat domain-containing protein n=1 Tax=Nostoc sp. TaxID=1180 RepID=UPI002FF67296